MIMEDIEYKRRLVEIEDIFNESKKELYIEYAMSNRKYKKGDVIKDSRWAFKIDKITTSISISSIPEPVYHGYELKKDLTPRKDKSRVCIYGHDNVELITK